MAGISRAYKRRNNMVANTGGPVLCLDAGSMISYPGSGTTWTDLSGNGNTGTLTNGPTYSSANGGSIVFDNVNDYVEAVYNATLDFGTGDFTVGIWVKTSNHSAYQLIFGRDNGSTGVGIIIYSSITSGVILSWVSNSGVNGTIDIANGNWHHVVLSRASGVVRQYVDGQFDVQVNSFGNVNMANNNTVRLGNYAVNGYQFNGSIANASIYNRALSAAEISQNFNLLRGRYGV